MNTFISLPRTLLLAGSVGLAGLAQAQTFDFPQQAGEASTMTRGIPNLLTTNTPPADTSSSAAVDTTVLGAGPAVVTTDTGVTTRSYVGPVVTWTQPMPPRGYLYTLPAPVIESPAAIVIQNY